MKANDFSEILMKEQGNLDTIFLYRQESNTWCAFENSAYLLHMIAPHALCTTVSIDGNHRLSCCKVTFQSFIHRMKFTLKCPISIKVEEMETWKNELLVGSES